MKSTLVLALLICAGIGLGCGSEGTQARKSGGSQARIDAGFVSVSGGTAGVTGTSPASSSPGGTGGMSSNSVTGGAVCTGTVNDRACVDKTELYSCWEAQGCYWTKAYTEKCFGKPYACETFLTQAACVAQAGCIWPEKAGVCSGKTVPCGDHDQSAACAAQPGCSWLVSEPFCSGTAVACGSHSDEASCAAQPGCFPTKGAGACLEQAAPACGDLQTAETCTQQLGCIWAKTSPVENCIASPKGCLGLGSKEDCATVPWCSWSTSVACAGIPAPCRDNGSEATCLSANGCRFSSGPVPYCAGTSACSALKTSSSCLAAKGCSWSNIISCTGVASECESQHSQESCPVGCRWLDSDSSYCYGNPSDCDSVPASSCTNQPGCVLQTH